MVILMFLDGKGSIIEGILESVLIIVRINCDFKKFCDEYIVRGFLFIVGEGIWSLYFIIFW